MLQERGQTTVKEICELRPLNHGLPELFAYLQLASHPFKAPFDSDEIETVYWTGEDAAGNEITRSAKLPRVIFVE